MSRQFRREELKDIRQTVIPAKGTNLFKILELAIVSTFGTDEDHEKLDGARLDIDTHGVSECVSILREKYGWEIVLSDPVSGKFYLEVNTMWAFGLAAANREMADFIVNICPSFWDELKNSMITVQ